MIKVHYKRLNYSCAVDIRLFLIFVVHATIYCSIIKLNYTYFLEQEAGRIYIHINNIMSMVNLRGNVIFNCVQIILIIEDHIVKLFYQDHIVIV